MGEDELNLDQLSMQIIAINDAIQILARNGTSVEQHSKEIEGLIKKTGKNDDRLREIEGLIHQSCELKGKEMQEQKETLHEHISSATERSITFTKYTVGSLAGVGILLASYLMTTMDTRDSVHTAFEAKQDEKADKIYQEIFGVLREIKRSMSIIREELAVQKTNQAHYQEILHNHMEDEEVKWRSLK